MIPSNEHVTSGEHEYVTVFDLTLKEVYLFAKRKVYAQ